MNICMQHATQSLSPRSRGRGRDLAPRVDVRRVFPLRLPRRVWGIPLLLAATLGFSMLKITPLHFDDARDAGGGP